MPPIHGGVVQIPPQKCTPITCVYATRHRNAHPSLRSARVQCAVSFCSKRFQRFLTSPACASPGSKTRTTSKLPFWPHSLLQVPLPSLCRPCPACSKLHTSLYELDLSDMPSYAPSNPAMMCCSKRMLPRPVHTARGTERHGGV